MKNFKLLLLCCSLSFVFEQAYGQLTEKNYRIYSVKSAKEVTVKELVNDMSNFDVMFLGEEHNDSVAHYLQKEVLKALHEKFGKNTTLSMEMFETDCQVVLDEYLAGFIREKNFKKEGRAWSNYKDYRPLIEYCKENRIQVIAANAPARYANMAARMGLASLNNLSAAAKSFLPPLPYDTASGNYYKKFTDLMSDGANAGIQPTSADTSKKKIPAANSMMPLHIVHSQSLWDASMAYSMHKSFSQNKNQKIFQINGRFHSDEHFGIVTQLKKYNPKLNIMVVSTLSDKSFPKIKWEEHKNLGDYIIITDPDVPKTFKE